MQANQASVTFNTHEAVKALKSSGFDEKQAESVVETINKAVNETVATKADLAILAAKMATKDDIKDMATKADIKDMATKDDIKDMATKADLEVQGAKIEALRETVEGIQENIEKTMDTKISKLETRMLRMMLLQSAVLVGLLIPVFGMLITLVVKLL